MAKRPTLKTKRLILRPHTLDDAQAMHRLLQERDIADTAYNLPYPYLKGMAEEWIGSRQESFDKGEGVEFAITNRQEGYLIGGIGLKLDKANARAELGYWIGKPYWNQGYCTEAARAVVKYGFEVLKLNRIHANHITRNPASGRVMQKIGMQHEGTRRQHVKRWGKFEDSEVYGILRSEYLAQEA